jgi:hypothetical protein
MGEGGQAVGTFADYPVGFMFARAHSAPPLGVLPAQT